MSEVSQDWQMYILAVIVELLSDFKGTHTHTDIIPSLTLFLFVFGGFHVCLSHSSEHKHTRALSSPSHLFLIETVTSRWLGAVTALCLVGSCRRLEPRRFEDCVETKPAL
ncbi:hypothetical protein PAMP_009427 [Pampus punctatissimus]